MNVLVAEVCEICGMEKRNCVGVGEKCLFCEPWHKEAQCQWCGDNDDFSNAPYGICYECGRHGPKAIEAMEAMHQAQMSQSLQKTS